MQKCCGNGYETWKSSSLYAFVGYFGGWPTKAGKNLNTKGNYVHVLIQLTKRSISIV